LSHQQPQQFQVLINEQKRLGKKNKTNIHFITNRHLNNKVFQKQKCHTGYFNIATYETLAFDLIQYQNLCGGLYNIGNILYEMGSLLNEKWLLKNTILYPIPIVQRLGYLLDFLGHSEKTKNLNAFLQDKKNNYVLLSRGQTTQEVKDKKWKIIVRKSALLCLNQLVSALFLVDIS